MNEAAVTRAREAFSAKMQTPNGAYQELLAQHTGRSRGYVPCGDHALVAVLSSARLQDVVRVLAEASRCEDPQTYESERRAAADLIGGAAVALAQVATALRLDFETLFHLAAAETAEVDGSREVIGGE